MLTPADREELARIRETTKTIAADMEADVRRFDGRSVSGRTIAEIHGTLAATCTALAGISGKLADIVERLDP